ASCSSSRARKLAVVPVARRPPDRARSTTRRMSGEPTRGFPPRGAPEIRAVTGKSTCASPVSSVMKSSPTSTIGPGERDLVELYGDRVAPVQPLGCDVDDRTTMRPLLRRRPGIELLFQPPVVTRVTGGRSEAG